jgi:hypothetical protein
MNLSKVAYLCHWRGDAGRGQHHCASSAGGPRQNTIWRRNLGCGNLVRFQSQFKRGRIPPNGPKVVTRSLSPRDDWRSAVDGKCAGVAG